MSTPVDPQTQPCRTSSETDHLLQQALCHCNDCQKLTGTSYSTNVLVPRPSYKLTAGSPKFWTFTQKPSGIAFKTTFCGECGGRLSKESEDPAFKDVIIVQAGTAEGSVFGGKPNVELWAPHRQEWVGAVEGAAQAETFS